MATSKVDPRQPGMTRRQLIERAAAIPAAAGLAGTIYGNRAAMAAEAEGVQDDPDLVKKLEDIYNTADFGYSPVLQPVSTQNHWLEPPTPDDVTLDSVGIKGEYDVDVLVVGGGFSGIYAADEAFNEGKDVMLVDKAIIGHSGLTPWAHTFAYFDEDLGDSKEEALEMASHDSEWSARLDYFEQFLDHSKEIYESGLEWGWLHPHDWETQEEDGLDPRQKFQAHIDTDRRSKLRQHIVDLGIPFLERTMITKLLTDDSGRVVGAVGFYEESQEPIVFKAKAVILCTGCGAVRPSGFPTGSATWDGDKMAYEVGAEISGKEYTDFHWTQSDRPGDIYTMWWRAFEEGQLLFPAHFPSDSNMISDVLQVDANHGYDVPPKSQVEDILKKEKEGIDAKAAENAGAATGDDPRTALGNTIGPAFLWQNREVKECAIGMGLPNEEGIYPKDVNGFSGVDGLWAAGCALGSLEFGSAYVCMGGSSCSCCIQGREAAKAACAYVDGADAPDPSQDTIDAAVDEMLAPLKLEQGFSPDWAEEILVNIMVPYWVAYMKSDETLNAALSQLTTARDKIVPYLRARNAHELRYVHEAKSEWLNCEMRLRSGLFRTESRGMHYRYDYPYRDDENWMCFVTCSKGDDGEIQMNKEPMDDAWKGDLSEDYGTRYPRRWPGELEYWEKADPAVAESIKEADAAAAAASAAADGAAAPAADSATDSATADK